MHAQSERDQFAVDMVEGLLHLAKEATRSRESEQHRAELAKAVVTFVNADAFLGSRDLCQDAPKAIGTMWWQRYCHVDCVKYSS